MDVETLAVAQQHINEDVCVLTIEEPNEMKDVGEILETSDENSLNNDVTTNHPVSAVICDSAKPCNIWNERCEPFIPDLTRFSCDVQHGYRIFCDLLSDQYKAFTRPFHEPVDVEGLGLWDYYTRIETPMSFRQIDVKFKSYLYQSITEIISDLRLILENCYRYNGLNHWISKIAQKLENVLDQKLALLSRSLRDKVSLQATMAFRTNKSAVVTGTEYLGGRRRRSGRSNYVNGATNDQTSRLLNHLLLEEEETQKELRKQKEKERKEANEALMQELADWENETFSPDIVNELKSMWEVPSIGSFLWLFQEALNLPELNYTEFEFGLVIPNKSHQMAWIFTVLLVTPNQRKSVHKKPPMRFTVWQRKLKDRLDTWYMTRKANELVTHQIGPDNEFFEILGDSNPLETKSFLDLSLHQRVLILKALCDQCVDYEYNLRDYLGNADATPFREVILGNDGESCSYVYFPIFDATDLRIYKQAPLPSSAEWYKKWKSNNTSGHVKQSGCVNRSRKSDSRKSVGSKSSRSIEEGFELVCWDVDTLRELCERFADQTTTPSGKKRRGRPPRKHSEKVLHERLLGLLEDLGVSDGRYGKARIKGMMNLMKEWKIIEHESDDESIAQSETLVEDDNVIADEPHATPLVIQPSEVQPSLSQDRPDESMLSTSMDTSTEMTSHGGSLLSRVTRSKDRPTTKKVFGHTPPSLETPDCNVRHISRNNTVSENPVNIVSAVSVKPDDKHDVIPSELMCSENKVVQITENIESNITRNVVATVTDKRSDVASSFSNNKINNIVIRGETPLVLSSRTIFQTKNPAVESTVTVDRAGTDGVCNKDNGGATGGSSVKESTVNINGTKEKDNLGKSMNMRDNDVIIGIKRDIDGKTGNVGKVVVNQEPSDTIPRNIVNTGVVEDIVVHQNGNSKQLSVCNGDYEPANKCHCSAVSHNTMKDLPIENQSTPLETKLQSPVVKILRESVQYHACAVGEHAMKTDIVSLETTHHSPVVKTLNENVQTHASLAAKLLVTNTDRVSLETSHQSPVKT